MSNVCDEAAGHVVGRVAVVVAVLLIAGLHDHIVAPFQNACRLVAKARRLRRRELERRRSAA